MPLILFIPKCWLWVGQHCLCPSISWSLLWLTPLHKIAAGMKANTSLKFSLQSKQQLLFLLRMAHIFSLVISLLSFKFTHVSRFGLFSPTNLQLYPEAFNFRAGYNNKDSESLSAFALLFKWQCISYCPGLLGSKSPALSKWHYDTLFQLLSLVLNHSMLCAHPRAAQETKAASVLQLLPERFRSW